MSVTVSVKHAATILGVSERTVWRRIRDGRLGTVRADGRVLVVLEAGQRDRRVAERATGYGPSVDVLDDPVLGVWPYDTRAHERHRARLREQREAVLVEVARLAREVKPDPDGLTSLDYLDEIRGPWPAPAQDR